MPDNCCFDDWARHDARRARRRRRPDGVTMELVAALDRAGLEGRSVLDVGCGAGELALACLARGAARATGTDLSPAAVEEARSLAGERGWTEQVRFRVADGATDALQPHDVVALNRVVCCFPDAAGLVGHAAAAAARTFAFVVPRSAGPPGVLNRALIGAGNLTFRLRRSRFGDYRAFVHDVASLETQLAAAGFRQVHRQHVRGVWLLSVHQRQA